jgi:hypothetical protein
MVTHLLIQATQGGRSRRMLSLRQKLETLSQIPNTNKRSGSMAEVIEYKQEALDSIPGTAKKKKKEGHGGVAVHTFNPSYLRD